MSAGHFDVFSESHKVSGVFQERLEGGNES